jgi:hypothetical protein
VTQTVFNDILKKCQAEINIIHKQTNTINSCLNCIRMRSTWDKNYFVFGLFFCSVCVTLSITSLITIRYISVLLTDLTYCEISNIKINLSLLLSAVLQRWWGNAGNMQQTFNLRTRCSWVVSVTCRLEESVTGIHLKPVSSLTWAVPCLTFKNRASYI